MSNSVDPDEMAHLFMSPLIWIYAVWLLIRLIFNDTSNLVGHFVSSPREREKRDGRGDERRTGEKGKWMIGGERTESKCRKHKDHDLWYGLDLLQSSGKFPCAICHTGEGSNSIFCNGCKYRVHKKCSGLKRLTKDPDYRCTRCQETAHPLDGRPQREVQVGPDKLEVVASFCYLGDMLSAAGDCEFSTTKHVYTAWKKFKELLPVLLFLPPLFQDTWPCVQFLCAERDAPCQWDLAIDKAKPPTSAAKWQGQCHHQIQ